MTAVFLSLAILAGPFWSEKPPAEWTDEDLQQVLTNSPWAKTVTGQGGLEKMPPIQVELATAGPIIQARAETRRRTDPNPEPDPERPRRTPDAEFEEWLAGNRASHIVLSIQVEDTYAYLDEKEAARFEKESVMRVGRKKVPMTGYFPPNAADPYVRLAFPRQVDLSDKELRFELYLPGVTAPYRTVEFRLDDLVVNGQLEL